MAIKKIEMRPNMGTQATPNYDTVLYPKTSTDMVRDSANDSKTLDTILSEINSAIASKQANLGFTPINKAGDNDISGHLTFINDKGIFGKDTSGNLRNLVLLNSLNSLLVGDVNHNLYLYSKITPKVKVGANTYDLFHTGNFDPSTKVDKVSGKSLTSNDFTDTLLSKLNGIDTNANNYSHPSTHSATMIVENSTHRFVTDSEKSTWNGKQNALGYTPVNKAGDTILGNLLLSDTTDVYSHEILFRNATKTMGIDYSNSGSMRFINRNDNTVSAELDIVSKAMTIGGNTVWTSGNGGAGSGLDADLLDGKHASAFSLAHSHPYIPTSEKGAINGVASLGSDGKVPTAQLPSLNYIPMSQKGVASGVATLDTSGKVTSAQLPSFDWNSITGKPTTFTPSTHTHSYLPLTGGSLSGALTLDNNIAIQGKNTTGKLLDILDIASNDNVTIGSYDSTIGSLILQAPNHSITAWDGNLSATIWHSRNHGTGSGLDADKLDGYHASSFSQASHTHDYLPTSGGTITGALRIYQSGATISLRQSSATSPPFLEFADENGARKGYIGYGSPANSNSMYIYNANGGGTYFYNSSEYVFDGNIDTMDSYISGKIQHTSNYFRIYPYSATYDDGSHLRGYWSGTDKCLVLQNAGGVSATPRIQLDSDTVLTRGNSAPVHVGSSAPTGTPGISSTQYVWVVT